jgi:hypothetical protein
MPEPSCASTRRGDPDAIRDVRVVPLTEEERAASLAACGATVVRHRGRPWHAVRPGFFEPVHLLARLEAHEATRPSPLAWGFRAALASGSAPAADATLPLHVLEDLQSWDPGRLSPRRRGKLRRCGRDAVIVPLREGRLLEEQGYAIYASHLARTRHRRVPAEPAFRAQARRLVTAGRPLVLVALVEGRLAGWVHGTAVEGVAYVDDVVVGTAFLPHQLGLGLNVELLLAFRRSPGLHTVVHGLHAREDPGLDEFKEGLGFRVVRVPARVSLPAPVRLWLRLRRPHVHYRLTGR